MKFYYVYTKTYHNSTLIGTAVSKMLSETEPKAETIYLTWENLDEWYSKNGLLCKFNIWNSKKGRRVSFFVNKFVFNKDEKDVKEWKTDLNIRIEISYKEYSPSIEEVLKCHDTKKVIIYLNERGLKIN